MDPAYSGILSTFHNPVIEKISKLEMQVFYFVAGV
jgi:hypothetical protein